MYELIKKIFCVFYEMLLYYHTNNKVSNLKIPNALQKILVETLRVSWDFDETRLENRFRS